MREGSKLQPAQLYKDELSKAYIKTWYDPRYRYYRCWSTQILNISENNYDVQQFAVVDKDEVIGYISFSCNWPARMAHSFSVISFKPKASITIGRAVLDTFDHILYDLDFRKIEFWGVAGNPAVETYRKLMNKYGGKECGTLHESVLVDDGHYADQVMFEIFAEDYKKVRHRDGH